MITMTRRFALVAVGSLSLAGCAMEVEGEDEADAELTEVEAAGSQVCIFEHANYLGKSACWGGIPEGGKFTVPDLFDAPVGDNQASSIKVKKGMKVRFYSDIDREGADYRINGYFGAISDPNIGIGGKPFGNDSLSSIYIERLRSVAGDWDPEDWQVCLYSDADYKGASQCWGGVPRGGKTYVPSLFHTAVGNDRASSIQLRSGVKVRLYSAVNFLGSLSSFSSSDRNLSGNIVGNDALSSFVIEVED